METSAGMSKYLNSEIENPCPGYTLNNHTVGGENFRFITANFFTTVLYVSFVAFCLFTNVACQPSPDQIENKAWSNAMSTPSEQVLKKYLSDFPEGKYVDQAKRALEAVAFRDAAWAHNETSYLDFSEKWPNSRFAPYIEELSNWLVDGEERSDNVVLFSANIQLASLPTDEAQEKSQTLVSDTKSFLECAGFNVIEPNGQNATVRQNRLDVSLIVRPVDAQYRVDGEDITISSGSRLVGNLRWTPKHGDDAGHMNFQAYDQPQEAIFIKKGRRNIEKAKSNFRTSSLHVVLRHPNSYYDNIALMAVTKGGPRAMLCPAGSLLDREALWRRIQKELGRPNKGAIIAALYSNNEKQSHLARDLLGYKLTSENNYAWHSRDEILNEILPSGE